MGGTEHGDTVRPFSLGAQVVGVGTQVTRKHVKIFPNGNGGTTITVDGVDVSGFVNHSGVAVEFDRGAAYVWLPVVPATFSGDLPGAVVNALSGTQEREIPKPVVALWAEQLHRAWVARDWNDALGVIRDMRAAGVGCPS